MLRVAADEDLQLRHHRARFVSIFLQQNSLLLFGGRKTDPALNAVDYQSGYFTKSIPRNIVKERDEFQDWNTCACSNLYGAILT